MKQYKVTCQNLFLRRGPSQKSGALKLLKHGDIATSEEDEKGGWLYAEFQGTAGYLPAKYLSEADLAQYDDDNIGAALETAIANAYAALDELKTIVKQL